MGKASKIIIKKKHWVKLIINRKNKAQDFEASNNPVTCFQDSSEIILGISAQAIGGLKAEVTKKMINMICQMKI